MRIATRQEIGPAWDAFCLAHPGAFFWWTNMWLDYQVARGATDLSFGILDGDRLVAICPLLLEEREGVRSFTMEGHPGPVPLFLYDAIHWDRKEGCAVCILNAELDRLQKVHNVSIGRFRWHLGKTETFEIKADKGPNKDISWHSQYLDLTQSYAALHASFTHGVKQRINKAERTYRLEVDTTGALIEPFRLLHIAQAGRETRPKATWDMMGQWCRDGYGLIVGAWRDDRLVGAQYFYLYKNASYNGHTVTSERNVAPALMWQGILALKASDVRVLEIGWPDYPKTEKQASIGRYFQSFGGYQATVVAVERRWER